MGKGKGKGRKKKNKVSLAEYEEIAKREYELQIARDYEREEAERKLKEARCAIIIQRGYRQYLCHKREKVSHFLKDENIKVIIKLQRSIRNNKFKDEINKRVLKRINDKLEKEYRFIIQYPKKSKDLIEKQILPKLNGGVIFLDSNLRAKTLDDVERLYQQCEAYFKQKPSIIAAPRIPYSSLLRFNRKYKIDKLEELQDLNCDQLSHFLGQHFTAFNRLNKTLQEEFKMSVFVMQVGLNNFKICYYTDYIDFLKNEKNAKQAFYEINDRIDFAISNGDSIYYVSNNINIYDYIDLWIKKNSQGGFNFISYAWPSPPEYFFKEPTIKTIEKILRHAKDDSYDYDSDY